MCEILADVGGASTQTMSGVWEAGWKEKNNWKKFFSFDKHESLAVFFFFFIAGRVRSYDQQRGKLKTFVQTANSSVCFVEKWQTDRFMVWLEMFIQAQPAMPSLKFVIFKHCDTFTRQCLCFLLAPTSSRSCF